MTYSPLDAANPLKAAEAVREEMIRLLGGALSPDYIYVLGEEPKRQGEPKQAMSLWSHGWSDDKEGVAELVAEEAYAYIERAWENVRARFEFVEMDYYSTAVAVFWEV